MATFRKNKQGVWVVFGTVSEVGIGKVRVSRKDGSVRSVNVASVGRPFTANGQAMVYGYLEARDNDEAPVQAPVDDEALIEAAAEAAAENAAEDAALRQAENYREQETYF